MVQVGGIAGERLRSLIERIERLLEERAAIDSDIREVYAEGKAEGFDVKIMRRLIRLRQMEEADRDEQETRWCIRRTATAWWRAMWRRISSRRCCAARGFAGFCRTSISRSTAR